MVPSSDTPPRRYGARPKQSGGHAHLPSLTPLRGVAALWVVAFHYGTQVFPNLPAAHYTHVVAKGYLAVDLFFLLSGFVITHVYHGAFVERVDKRRYWSFLAARIARLYPAHIWVLLLFVATTLGLHAAIRADADPLIPLGGPRSLLAVFANLFMAQGLHASALSWNYPEWSVSLEFLAYLALPFLLPRLSRAGAAGRTVTALCAFAVLALLWRLSPDFNQWDGPLALLRCLPEFLLGALLYTVHRSGAGAAILSRDRTLLATALGTALMVHWGAPDILIVPTFAALILAAVANDGRAHALVNARGLVWLGEISYSLYLLHGFVQFVTTDVLLRGFGVGDPASLSQPVSAAVLFLMLASTFVLAAFNHRHIELAGRRLLRAALLPARTSRSAPPVPASHGLRCLPDSRT